MKTTANMHRLLGLMLSVALLSYSCVTVNAEDGGQYYRQNEALIVDKYDSTTTRRNNFCDLQAAFHAGEVDLRSAFKGRNLTVAIGLDRDFVNFENKENIGEGWKGDILVPKKDPGLMIEIFNEVARRAGFQWENTFVWQYPPENGNSEEDISILSTLEEGWSDVLHRHINAYDVSVEWWANSRDRINKGASFPKGWMDGSAIILQKQDNNRFRASHEFQLFSWHKPFTLGVWASIVATIFVTAFVSIIVTGKTLKDLAESTPFRGSSLSVILTYIHQAFLVFTGNVEISPNTHGGQWISFSISFVSMLILSTYTANLASFLVIEKASLVKTVQTVRDIVDMDGSICVFEKSVVHDAMTRVFQDEAQLVLHETEKGVLRGLKDDECEYALISLSTWETLKGVKEYNEGCEIRRIGRPFRQYQNGFAVKIDAGTFCTSLVGEMLDLHLRDMMEEDNFIADAWKQYNEDKHDIDGQCLENSFDIHDESTDTLNLVNVGGIFILHIVLVVIGLFVYLFETDLKQWKQHKQKFAKMHDSDRTLNATWSADKSNNILDLPHLDEVKESIAKLESDVQQISISLLKLTTVLGQSTHLARSGNLMKASNTVEDEFRPDDIGNRKVYRRNVSLVSGDL